MFAAVSLNSNETRRKTALYLTIKTILLQLAIVTIHIQLETVTRALVNVNAVSNSKSQIVVHAPMAILAIQIVVHANVI